MHLFLNRTYGFDSHYPYENNVCFERSNNDHPPPQERTFGETVTAVILWLLLAIVLIGGMFTQAMPITLPAFIIIYGYKLWSNRPKIFRQDKLLWAGACQVSGFFVRNFLSARRLVNSNQRSERGSGYGESASCGNCSSTAS